MARRWRFFPFDEARISHLERSAGVPSIVAQLLLCRGITDPAAARGFLEPRLTGLRDPGALAGVSEAAEKLAAAAADKKRIVIYGDYDADGISATAILVRCLRLLGANVGYYVPSRLEQGYGLNEDALRQLAREGTQTVVTVDCGIASCQEALIARELGLELIVTDHHELAPELPVASCLVHPRLPGRLYPFAGLSGAGVAFKLAWGVCQAATRDQRVSQPLRTFLLQAVGLATLGTIADVVPLLDENRILVRDGLKRLCQSPVVGMSALLKITELAHKSELTSEDVAFSIAPRLNAAGRLGQAQLAVELLTTDSQERATALAEYLHELNNSRGSLERSVYLAANKQAQDQFDPSGDPALVLADVGWHAGVIGIVAGRLVEKYHRPVVLVSFDPVGVKPGIGSARSIPSFSLHEALAACSDHLLSHGGHAAAAGLKIEEPRLRAFREDFCEYAAAEIAQEAFTAELFIDAEAPLPAITEQVVRQIEQLAPFGQENRRPILCATGVRLAEPPQKMGGGGRHLSCKITQAGVSRRAVAFGKGEWAEELAELDGPIDIAFQPVLNEFRGRVQVELHLCDWQPSAVGGGLENAVRQNTR